MRKTAPATTTAISVIPVKAKPTLLDLALTTTICGAEIGRGIVAEVGRGTGAEVGRGIGLAEG